MKKIIVTGCNGQLGRAVNLFFRDNKDISFVNTDVGELDITNIDKVMELAREVQPYAIINCAAHTGVDACETEYDKAFKINAIGPRNLSIAARETGAKLMHISTDYVFDGKGTRPYVETDATNPQGAYGSTKLAGENFVKDFADRYFILRTAWLYGDGKNFAKTMLRLSETNKKGESGRRPVRISHQCFRAYQSYSCAALYGKLRCVPCNLRRILQLGGVCPGGVPPCWKNNTGGGDYH